MTEETLNLLRCPEDQSKLRFAEPELMRRVSQAVADQRLVDRRGRVVARPFEQGLVRGGGDLLYPIVDQIPVLLIDEAIPLAQLTVPKTQER